MAITLLITGFGPFPGAPKNPTGLLALRLARRRRPAFVDARRLAHVFATSYQAVERELPLLIARHRPDALLMFGLASRARHIRIEMRARNAISSTFPDADRRKAKVSKLAKDGPAWIATRTPCATLLQAARAAGVPAILSRDAGRYLCNALYWRALEAATRPGGPRVAAFVHVPQLKFIAASDLERAGDAILRAVLAAARRPR